MYTQNRMLRSVVDERHTVAGAVSAPSSRVAHGVRRVARTLQYETQVANEADVTLE